MDPKSDPDQSAVKPATTLPLKELVVLLPIVASAVAIAYDVGYFIAFDLDYFSFFSLSEHLVFALQALPLALVFSLLPIVFLGGRKDLVLPATWKNRLIGGAFAVGAVAFALIGFFTFAAIGFCGSVIMSVRFSFPKPELPIAVLAVPMALMVSMAAGLDAGNGKRYRSERTHVIKTTTGGDVEGTLIRSGERGVFFHFAASREVGVIRWDSIKEIVTKRPTPARPPWIFR